MRTRLPKQIRNKSVLRRGSPRFSRNVTPSYSRRNMPRPLQFRHHLIDEIVQPAGQYGNMMLKPSLPPVSSHSCISSAIAGKSGVKHLLQQDYFEPSVRGGEECCKIRCKILC